MDIKKTLGKRIQYIRKSKNITQEKLAELIGINVSSISHIENGKYFPTAENLNSILFALNIYPYELFNKEDDLSYKELIDEMLKAMNKNENLTKLMYKFYSTIKYMT